MANQNLYSKSEIRDQKSEILSPELLAPAGDWDSLIAGLAAGADAVYLGGKLFSARQSAVNFDPAELRKACDLLHLQGKKIYVTVNTLINDSELEDAFRYLQEIYNIGVDAVIVQDLGLISLIRHYLPDLEIHASTQMTIHNTEGALFLKSRGIKRVVLARELTGTEVEAIINESGLEVEVFIHGALCVCYSGQCLLSSMIGGRSGNRGRCAQPCRMEYQLLRDGQVLKTAGSFLLSPKDLALFSLIPELFRIGVRSLKIEGRMKRPEYVYSVVRVYRRLLDRYLADPAGFRVEPSETKELEEPFNRGFTTGYFGRNRNADLMSFSRPNNRGVYLGRIKTANYSTHQVTLELEADLEVGDQVEVWISQGGRAAGPIRSLNREGRTALSASSGQKVGFEIGGRINPGDRVFKVFSSRLSQEMKRVLSEAALKIPLSAEVDGACNQPLRLTFRDGAGNEGTAISSLLLRPAQNRPLTTEVFKEHLGRIGNTPFSLAELHLKIGENQMLPLSELNQVRREALMKLIEAKLQPFQRPPVQFTFFRNEEKFLNVKPAPVLLSAWAADLKSVKEAAKAGVDLIYVGGDELIGFHWETGIFKEALEIAHRAGSRLVIGLPRINREGQLQQLESYLQEVFLLEETDGIIVSDLGGLYRVMTDTDLPIFLNYTLNVFNSYTAQSLSDPRIKQITLSPELTLEQIKKINSHSSPLGLEVIIHGPMELMVSEYCPVGAAVSPGQECGRYCGKAQFYLRDRLNLDFPVFTDQFCRMHLMNSKDLCLYEDLVKLVETPGLVLRLELKSFSSREATRLIHAYKSALDSIRQGLTPTNPERVIKELSAISGRGITKGHYFRGVE